ncbi:MAG TPA: plastocyanin/azurin family copper-binding protein [Methylomirabilota bacterium]|jgi:plastocyanin|nr:plastocyanin/azurin family copper-binding protein [Methylomirabilota bacterium]
MIRRVVTAGVLTIWALAASAVAAAPPPGPVIGIEEFRFAAAAVTVPVGTTVTWVNHDEEPHTVTSTTQAFASPGLDTGESFSYRFTRPGTYTYFCALHPHMTARVIVR